MARSDLIVKLVKAWASSDRLLFKNTVEAIITDERSKNHHILADRLLENLRSVYHTSTSSPTNTDDRIASMLWEVIPKYQLSNLILSTLAARFCRSPHTSLHNFGASKGKYTRLTACGQGGV